MSNEQGPGSKPAKGPMVIIRKAPVTASSEAPMPVTPTTAETAPASETAAPLEATPAPAETQAPAPAASAPVKEKKAKAVPPRAKSPLYDDVPEEQSFEEMFEASVQDQGLPQRGGPKVGEKVTGTIFQLGKELAFVTLGQGKSEAQIEVRELQDDEGVLRFSEGDTLEAHVIEVGPRGVMLSRALTKANASKALLEEAAQSGIPVEGMVLSVNKGGLEVAVGAVRAFCPVSQIDVRFVENPDRFVGETLKFRVTEVRGKNVVLSRRALLEEEQKVQAEKLRQTLEVGSVVKGEVVGVRDFGAFVDLGGLEGLVPVSELSHVRIGHPSEVVNPGDQVEVEVIRMEPADPNSPDKSKRKERITLSMRSRLEDPFREAMASIKEGVRLQGKVVRLQPFGAFVELQPGVDGLIHISALSDRRIGHPRDVVKEGDLVWVVVEKVDPKEKRIGLRRITEEEAQNPAPVAPAAEAADRPKVGQIVTGKVDRIETFGIFIAFPGGTGLVPGAETGTERGTDYRRVFQIGQELKAQILDIDSRGKIKLSLTAAERAEERADMEAWMKSQPKASGTKGLGTFADLFSKLQK